MSLTVRDVCRVLNDIAPADNDASVIFTYTQDSEGIGAHKKAGMIPGLSVVCIKSSSAVRASRQCR